MVIEVRQLNKSGIEDMSLQIEGQLGLMIPFKIGKNLAWIGIVNFQEMESALR